MIGYTKCTQRDLNIANFMYYLFISGFCCALIISGCQGNKVLKPDFNLEQDDTSNVETEKSTFHEQDRTIWQKPYEVIHLLGPLEDKVVADIGAGSGFFSYRFTREAKKVIAIDIEPKLIKLINQEKSFYTPEIQEKLEARLATIDDSNLRDNEVDVIFISNTYIYLPSRIEYLKNLKSKLKLDGRIMIVDFKKKMTSIGPAQNLRLSQSDVEQELISAGYKILISNDVMLDYQYIIIAQVN